MDNTAKVIGFVGAAAVTVWQIWAIVVAFAGGTLPIPFINWQVDGGFWFGLLWLFVIAPIVVSVANFAFALLAALLLTPFSVANSKRQGRATSPRN